MPALTKSAPAFAKKKEAPRDRFDVPRVYLDLGAELYEYNRAIFLLPLGIAFRKQ